MSRRIVNEAPSPAPGIVSQTQPKKNGTGKEIFSHQLLSAMIAFRGGDFSVRLPANLTGLPGELADTFNDIVEVSERRARETSRVSRAVGKEGKLRRSEEHTSELQS